MAGVVRMTDIFEARSRPGTVNCHFMNFNFNSGTLSQVEDKYLFERWSEFNLTLNVKSSAV